jgi:hypothetical protein
LILTGHMRCWEMCFPSFKNKIIDVYNPDIFIHTWDNEAYWTNKTIPANEYNEAGYNINSPSLDINKVIQQYLPKNIVVENSNDIELEKYFSNRVNNIVNHINPQYVKYLPRPKNIISMVRKWFLGIQQMKKYSEEVNKQYDIVFRMRPDLIIHDNFPKLDYNTLYTNQGGHMAWGGTGDYFHISNMTLALSFIEYYNHLDDLIREHGFPCAHKTSLNWIQRNRIPHQTVSTRVSLQHTPHGAYREA